VNIRKHTTDAVVWDSTDSFLTLFFTADFLEYTSTLFHTNYNWKFIFLTS